MSDERPFWQSSPCPPWCLVEHLSIDDYEDRSCKGESKTVTLSLEKARYVENRAQRDAYWLPVRFETAVRHRFREAEPLVMVWTHNHQDVPRRSHRLTVDEAQAFAHAILDAVKEARS